MNLYKIVYKPQSYIAHEQGAKNMRPTTKTFINKLKKINLRGEYKGTNEMGTDLVCIYNKETMQTILNI